METNILATIIFGLLLTVILINRYKWTVFQWLGKGFVKVVIGVFLLFVANVLGGYMGYYVPFNLVTVGVAGLLGIPGVLSLVGIKMFIV